MDVVVTIARGEWLRWLAEGDLPGDESTGEWGLYFGNEEATRKAAPPKHLHRDDRVYICAAGFIRGYAPLVRVQDTVDGYALIRGGGAVACTVLASVGGSEPRSVKGFQGVRYRWWSRGDECPFPEWATHGLLLRERAWVQRLLRARENPSHRATLRERAITAMWTPPPAVLLRGLAA